MASPPDFAATSSFPRPLIMTGAMLAGLLLALTVHILGQRLSLDLGGLWGSEDSRVLVPASAALAWWLIAMVGFAAGYIAASLMRSAASGRIQRRLRQFVFILGLLLLAAAGQAASAPSAIPTAAAVLGGLTALCLGALMSFCGAYFAMRDTAADDRT